MSGEQPGQLSRLADLADRARAVGADDVAARALDLARRVVALRPGAPSRLVDTADVVDAPKPGDPPWRSRHAHRSLAPAVSGLLLEARLGLCLTVAEAAERIGITPRMVRYLEAGQRRPSTVVAEQLVEAYELDGDDAAAVRSVALRHVGRASPFVQGPGVR